MTRRAGLGALLLASLLVAGCGSESSAESGGCPAVEPLRDEIDDLLQAGDAGGAATVAVNLDTSPAPTEIDSLSGPAGDSILVVKIVEGAPAVLGELSVGDLEEVSMGSWTTKDRCAVLVAAVGGEPDADAVNAAEGVVGEWLGTDTQASDLVDPALDEDDTAS
ncbi:MAG: hypothetical protein S0880_18910 [Actinomycetota bacterium]|nr:hypothetical protein [Actinomycetota bacterium]